MIMNDWFDVDGWVGGAYENFCVIVNKKKKKKWILNVK